MSENTGQIYGLLAKLAKSLPAVPKAQENRDQGYSFRGIADVIDAVHGPMADIGIVVVPEVLDILHAKAGATRSGTPTIHLIVRYAHTFYAPDGSHVRAVTLGEGVDTSDKAANKCHSAALKYALNEVLMLAYDVDEGDEGSPEQPVAQPEAPPAAAPAQAPAPRPSPRPAARPAPAPRPQPPAGGVRCPKCGGEMVLRHGRKGDFYGCKNYRSGKCDGTLDARDVAAGGDEPSPEDG